jgi:transposase-like protein
MWVWVAFEPQLKVFLAFHISYNQSILDAHIFLKELRHRYGRKSIWTDEASWYPEACRWSRLEHHVYRQEWKNLIERMNEWLKDRLDCFDDLFSCLKDECEREHVHNWISVFRFYHNYVKGEREDRETSVGYDDGPEYRRFIDLLATKLLT